MAWRDSQSVGEIKRFESRSIALVNKVKFKRSLILATAIAIGSVNPRQGESSIQIGNSNGKVVETFESGEFLRSSSFQLKFLVRQSLLDSQSAKGANSI
jgi:hypothetical protein